MAGKGKDGTSSSLRSSLRPLSSLQGYTPSKLARDLAAGAVIAALSIPIAMGYAQIAGLSAGYGLLASIVAPLAFGLVTATGTIVFGMDSATSAITGAVLAGSGYALGSAGAIEVMPLFTLLTAAFLLLFALCRVGKAMRLVPIPVMNGFVVGVSVSVIVGQVPLLLGVDVPAGGGFLGQCAGIAMALGRTNAPTLLVSVSSIALLLLLQEKRPKLPGALVVLVAMTALSAALGFEGYGVQVLGAVSLAMPHLGIPALGSLQFARVLGAAFVVALVVALESLLCLETFSIRAGVRAQGDRELLSFGLANVLCGLFCCAPCSASISRTAASADAGASSQVASMVSAAIVALVSLVFAPLLYALPRACLSAIVVVALVNVIDTRAIRRYVQHMRPALLAFGVTGAVVVLFGALPGVAVGVAISAGLLFYRRHHESEEALFGVVPQGRRSEPKGGERPDPEANYVLFKMSGSLNFFNIDRVIDELLSQMTPETDAVIVKISKVDNIDATATVKLFQLVEMLHARKIHVKFVRKMRPTGDHYTRYELGSIMQDVKTYPNVRSALAGLKRDRELEAEQGEVEGNLGDRPEVPKAERKEHEFEVIEKDEPVFSIHDRAEQEDGSFVVTGKIGFPRSKEAVGFEAEAKRSKKGKLKLTGAVLVREATEELLAEFDDGSWGWEIPKEKLAPAVDALEAYIASA